MAWPVTTNCMLENHSPFSHDPFICGVSLVPTDLLVRVTKFKLD